MGGQFNKFSQTIALKQTTPHTQAGDVTAEAFIQMSYVCHGMTKMLQEKKKKKRGWREKPLPTKGNVSLAHCLNSQWRIKKIKINPL